MKAARHRRLRWLWPIALVPLIIGVARLRLDVEVLNLLPRDERVVEGLRLYQDHFANARELLVSVQGAEPEAVEAAAHALASALRESTGLTASVTWQPPWLENPADAAELIAHLWLNQPAAVFGELTNRLSPANLEARLKTVREQLATSLSAADIAQGSYDPLGLTQLPESVRAAAPQFGQGQEFFSSGDGRFRILFIQAPGALAGYQECIDWLARVRAVEAAGRARQVIPPEVRVRYTGRPAFVAEISRGMEQTITQSVTGTMAIIAVLFWLAHRRLRPLLWLITLLVLILAGTVSLGGLILGPLNVLSLGFAAILLGLAVDYGLVLYQEAVAVPGADARAVRRQMLPGICWAAVTTAGAFLTLALSGLPGLGQLGVLVAIGIILAAIIMPWAYLPPLLRRGPNLETGEEPAARQTPSPRFESRSRTATSGPLAALATVSLILVAALVLRGGLPKLDHSAAALRPRNSEAHAALEEIKERMARTAEPLWLLVAGESEATVAARLDRARAKLEQAVASGQLSGFTLADVLWPRPDRQAANREAAALLGSREPMLRSAALAAGFTTNSLALCEAMLGVWREASASASVHWPRNRVSRWVMDKLVARTGNGFLALGLLYPMTTSGVDAGALPSSAVAPWAADLQRDEMWLTGWDLLGESVLRVVAADFWRVALPMVTLLLVSLWFTFRRLSEVLLSLAALGGAFLLLLAAMKLAGWSWNLMNLMALPLLLGSGVDYSIHTQLGLRRHASDPGQLQGTVGRALLLCAATTIAGFGSLAWTSNTGLASLGKVCATGIAAAYVVSVWILPGWWWLLARPRGPTGAVPATPDERLSRPSSWYRATVWRVGLVVAHWLPRWLGNALAFVLGELYWRLNPDRRGVVIDNLLPVLGGDRAEARAVSLRLFRNFAHKLADLWRYESGLPIDHLLRTWTGWEHFLAAQARGRGVLVVTPHLGNWEYGAPLLRQRGVELLVLTLAEPDDELTGLRQASRARWGIETLVVGQDPFAFVEVIRRLQAGQTVALLLDRPPRSTTVAVELFGTRFEASISAAELTRATGCALLPVYVAREGDGYAAHVLTEIAYDRRALGTREAREQFTREIMRAFEPVIRQHLDQWYHFVPIWPDRQPRST